ncbi:MAG: fumarylacetoacetate hydrolase family protein [Sphaerochaetaceae bacterium]|nr:fumarylacetoacetate hydrolase family protein [Sphaerochaetaceae bacterium]
MKLVTYLFENSEFIGILKEDNTIVRIPYFKDMNTLIEELDNEGWEKLRVLKGKEGEISLSSVKLLSPIPHPRQDILCLGLNYTDHAKEAKQYSNEAFSSDKAKAIYFSKRVNECLPDGGNIPAYEHLTHRLDYEVELAVILGKDAYDVKKEDVKDYIFGYSVFNDMSARDLQTEHKQWYFGKSLDGFCPMGPCILTADSTSYPPELRISSKVNGELRQDGNTNMFIHDIDEVVAELSQGMTLRKGTIIATGTPKGVAMGMDKPAFLKKGDVIICSIEKIGTLTNRIV